MLLGLFSSFAQSSSPTPRGSDSPSGPTTIATNSPPGDRPVSLTNSARAKIVGKGANEINWETITTVTNDYGQVASRTNKIQQLETGMHYYDGTEWKRSEPRFTENNDEFSVQKVQYKVHLKRDLNVGGAILISSPGLTNHFYATPVAIGIYNPVDGQFAVIGEITNCVGTLVSSNVVVYENPFADATGGRLCGSLVYTVGQASFEQDYVWQGALDVRDYGFDTNCWIQIISEVYQPSEADIMERPIYLEQNDAVRAAKVKPDLIDQIVGFGEIVLGTGHAYSAPTPAQPKGFESTVGKELRHESDGRTLLVESVPVNTLGLESLPDCGSKIPKQAGLKASTFPTKKGYASIVSPPRFAQSDTPKPKPAETARVLRRPTGPTIDYLVTYNGGTIGGTFVFDSATTYFLSGTVTRSGSVIIEGGTVIKYAVNAALVLSGTVTLKTSSYHPAVFTAETDSTIGETVTIGTIVSTGYANPALSLTFPPLTMSNCRFCYAKVGVSCPQANGLTLTVNHSQFWNCVRGVSLTFGGCGCGTCAASLTVNNCLMGKVTFPLTLPQVLHSTCSLINCTFDQATTLLSGWNSVSVNSTNCIFANITGWGWTPAGDHNGFYNNTPSPFGTSQRLSSGFPFKQVGAGGYYLADACGLRDVGITTGVSANLVADLKMRTTYAPNVQTKSSITTDLTLLPGVKRDTDLIDLGYHYDAVDYAYSDMSVLNGTLRLSPGAVLATFSEGGTTAGLTIGPGGHFESAGTPTQPNRIVQYSTVQEGSPSTWEKTHYASVSSETANQTPYPIINCRFTDWSMLVLNDYHFRAAVGSGPFNFQDCEFYGGMILSGGPTLNFTNCLFERVDSDIQPTDSLWSYFRNNLVRAGTFKYGPVHSTIKDNLFDQPVIPDLIGSRGNTYDGVSGGRNAYITGANRLQPADTAPIVLSASPAYKTGPLGNYYVPDTTTQLINQGSTTADLVGLYHYTTTTNFTSGFQNREGGSTLDVGYHYVALGTGNLPIDDDGDGIPSYVEDVNGNGLTDTGERSYLRPQITLSATPLVYQERAAAALLDVTQDAAVSAPDLVNLNGGSLRVEIISGVNLSDSLSIKPQGTGGANAIGVSGNTITYGTSGAGTGPMATFTGGSMISPLIIRFNSSIATPTAVKYLVRALTFYNGSDSPSSVSRTVSMTLTDGSGGASLPATKTVNVTAVNDNPIITLSSLPASYRPYSSPTRVDPTATVYDADSPSMNGGVLTVTITSPAAPNNDPHDRLGIQNSGNAAGQIGVTIDPTVTPWVTNIYYGGVLIGYLTGGAGTTPLQIHLNANSSPAAADALIRNVIFWNDDVPPTSPLSVNRILQFQITDGNGGTSDAKTKTLTPGCSPTALDIMLVLDRSTSMNTMDGSDTRLHFAMNAASNFVYAVSQANYGDYIGLVSFAWNHPPDSPHVDVAPTTTYSSVIGALWSLVTHDGTAIGTAVNTATGQFPSSGRNRIMVLLTDGEETEKSDPGKAANDAKGANVHLITVGLGTLQDTSTALLSAMASPRFDNAQLQDFYNPKNSSELIGVYDQIAASICRAVNLPPTVSVAASPCNAITTSGGLADVTLSGSATDTAGTSLTYNWSLVSFPESALPTIVSPSALTTLVHCNKPGNYVFRLTASDGSLSTSKDIPVTIFETDVIPNPLPIVDAGLPQTVMIGANTAVTLQGLAKSWNTSACATPAVKWIRESAPMGAASAVISQDTALSTTANGFTVPGLYVFRLTAADSGSAVCDGSNARAVCDSVTITACDQAATPVDVMLLFDVSGSMDDLVPKVRVAAKTFVDLLADQSDQIGLIPFSGTATVWNELTRDRALVERSINCLQPPTGNGSFTYIAPPLELALSELTGQRHNTAAASAIIILSDGQWGDDIDVIRNAANAAKAQGIRIITIGFTDFADPINYPDAEDWLAEVASSDADAYLVSSTSDLVQIYGSLADSFCLGHHRRPIVYASAERSRGITQPVQLTGSVFADGPVTVLWQDVTPSPAPGTVNFSPNATGLSPKVTFSAAGTYKLKLTATDSQSVQGSTTITINNGVGSPPVAYNDSYIVSYNVAGEPIVSYTFNLLNNDVDPDGDDFRVTQVSSATEPHGKLEIINAGKAIRYTPDLYALGSGEFYYTISDGIDGTSEGTVNVQVIPLNHPPHAVDDIFPVVSGSPAVFLDVLKNDTDPDYFDRYFQDKDFLRIVGLTPLGANQGTLSAIDDGFGNLLLYYTPPASLGTYTFSYTISDRLGASSTATVTLKVVQAPANQPPVVHAGPSQNLASVFPYASETLLQGSVIDDGYPLSPGFLEYSWEVVSQPSGSICDFLPPSSPTTFVSLTGDGVYTLRLKATDNDWVSYVSDTLTITVQPTTLIGSIDNLKEGDILQDGFFKALGVAEDTSHSANFSYQLKILQIDTATQQPILSPALITLPSVTTPVPRAFESGTLGTLDLTKLVNGQYALRLELSQGAGGLNSSVTTKFFLNSPLKLGRFAFSQQDFVIPVGGLPLSLTRNYDSFNTKQGAFGYGWSYDFADMDVQIDETRSDHTFFEEGQWSTLNIRTGGGRDVTLTLPGGQRVTYVCTFRNGLGYQYAEWVRPPGVFADLVPIDDARLSTIGILAWQAGGYHTPFENFDFSGFNLILPDGSIYQILREPLGNHTFAGDGSDVEGAYINAYGKCKLSSITRPNGEMIIFKEDRIEHYGAAPGSAPTHTLLIKHEDSNPALITSIIDPNGANGIDPVYKYEYTGGDLTKVRRLVRNRNTGGPVYEDTIFTYGNGTTAPLHYLVSIQDPRGQPAVRTYYYSGGVNDGRIYQVKDAKDHSTTFDYDFTDPVHRYQQSTDYLGNFTKKEFDSRGNVTESYDATSAHVQTTRTYDPNNLMISEIANNVGTIIEHDLYGNPTKQNISGAGIYQGTLFSLFVDLTTLSSFNRFGQLTTSTDPKSYAADPNSISSLNEYDGAGNLTAATDILLNKSTYTYFPSGGVNVGRLDTITDPLLNTTSHQYDSRGNVSSVTSRNPLSQILTSSSFIFDDNNNRLSESRTRTLSNGSIETSGSSSIYDPQNRVVESTDALGYSTTTLYNSIGKPRLVTDKRNNSTVYLYDSTGDLVETLYPDGSVAAQADYEDCTQSPHVRWHIVEDPHLTTETNVKGSRSIYDEMGRVKQTDRLEHINITITVAGEVATPTLDLVNPSPLHVLDDSSTLTHYDNAGRVDHSTDPLGRITDYGYDGAGRRTLVNRTRDDGVVESTYSEYDEDGNLKKTYLDYSYGQTHIDHAAEVDYNYDDLNRLTETVYPNVANVHDTSNPNKKITYYDALGRNYKEVDQAGIITGFAYDGLGRLVMVTNAYGLPDQTITGYAYDELSNLIRQTNAEGQVTSFAYDSLGRRTTRTLPGLQSESFGYDGAGNQTWHKDFNGSLTVMAYDTMNRLKAKTNGTYWVTFTYKPFGSRYTVTDSALRGTTYSYDNRNRLTQKISPEGVLQYTYDGKDNVSTVKSVKNDGVYNTGYGGISLTYTWDSFNRLKSVQDMNASGQPTTTYAYDDLDRLAKCDYPTTSPVEHTYGYNEASWLNNVTIKSGGTALKTFDYTFTGAGYGRTGARLSEKLNGSTRASYSYDPLYRLTNEVISASGTDPVGTIGYDSTAGYTDTSGFDKVGNRRSRASNVTGVGTASYNYNSNDRLTSDGYDNNGNTTAANSYTFSYDFENHLTQRTKFGATPLTFSYDEDGNRVRKTVGTTTTYFLVDAHNPTGYPQVVEELSTIGSTPATVYNYGLRLIAQRASGTLQYYGYDGHGNVRALLTSAGTVNQSYTYDAFGNLIAGPAPSSGSAYLYCGEQFDAELGLYYLRARYFSADKGRFWTMDTYEGSSDRELPHKYLYCCADPVNCVDPLGLKEFHLWIGFSYGFFDFATYSDEFKAATWWAQGSSRYQLNDAYIHVSIRPGDNIYERVKSKVDEFKPEAGDTLTSIDFSGHGRPADLGHDGNAAITLDDLLPGKDTPQQQLLGYLKPYSQGHCTVTLRACEQANGPDAQKMMALMAQGLGATVVGWDDWYAGWGRGNKYSVTADGKWSKVAGKPWSGPLKEAFGDHEIPQIFSVYSHIDTLNGNNGLWQ